MPAHKGYIRATPHGPDRPDDWRDRAAIKPLRPARPNAKETP